jgi:hypothetical protein
VNYFKYAGTLPNGNLVSVPAFTAYRFEKSAVLPPGDPDNAKDTAPVTVLSGLGIDLESVFAE